MPADIRAAVPQDLTDGAGAWRRQIVGGEAVFLHNDAARPGGACGYDSVASGVVFVRIELAALVGATVASHGEGDILIGEGGHGGVDDLLAGVEQFLRGVTGGEPVGDIGRRMGHVPIFAIALAKLVQTILIAVCW